MAHPFRDPEFEAVIEGVPTPIQIPDFPDIRVNGRTAANRRWPQIALGCRGGNYYISIRGTERLVNAPRANISDESRHAWGEFVLDAQIPLQHVIAMGLAFDGANRET